MATLTLDYIANYLCNDVKIKKIKKINSKFNKFPLDQFDYVNSKHFPNFLRKLFNDHLDRYGIIQKFKNENISVYYSVLFCIYNDFITHSNEEQMLLVKNLKKNILRQTKKGLINKNYKTTLLKLSKKNLVNKLNESDKDVECLLLSCFFDINIFLFDYNSNNIKCYYPEEEFYKHKNNVFLINKNEFCEPLIYKNMGTKIFSYTSSILEEILYSDLVNLNYLNYKKKKFIIALDYDKYFNIKLDDFENKIIDLEIKDISEDDFSDIENMSDKSIDYRSDYEDTTDGKEFNNKEESNMKESNEEESDEEESEKKESEKEESDEEESEKEESEKEESDEEESDEEESEKEESEEESNKIEYNKFPKYKLMKLRKAELLNICSNYKINIELLTKEKKEIIINKIMSV